MEPVKIIGKRNRKVAFLLTPDMQDAIVALLEARKKWILTENPFLFAVSKANRSISGWVA